MLIGVLIKMQQPGSPIGQAAYLGVAVATTSANQGAVGWIA
jgi:hypothetical protein